MQFRRSSHYRIAGSLVRRFVEVRFWTAENAFPLTSMGLLCLLLRAKGFFAAMTQYKNKETLP